MSAASAVAGGVCRLLVLHVRCAPTRHARSIPRRTPRLLPSSGRVAVPTRVGRRRPAAYPNGRPEHHLWVGGTAPGRPHDECSRLLRPPCALRGSRRSVEVERSAVFQERFQRDSTGAGAPGSPRSAGGSRRPAVGRADLRLPRARRIPALTSSSAATARSRRRSSALAAPGRPATPAPATRTTARATRSRSARS